MIIVLACLGSFTASIAVGMLRVVYHWTKANVQMEEILEKINKNFKNNA